MKLTIIGFGHMGSAIIEGALKAGILSPTDVTVADSFEGCRKKAEALGVYATSDNIEAVKDADVIILAVKPNNLADLAAQIRNAVPPSAVIVSICAGKRLDTLAEMFNEGTRIIRAMPNTPVLVGEGMSALCVDKNTTVGNLDNVVKIFDSFGEMLLLLDEDFFDTVTAVSGSGPAYVYAFIDALMNYAIERGMTPENAKTLAAQTVLGAAKMVMQSADSPQKLKQSVCSPNGTTIEAVKVLDERGFDSIIKDAAKACEERSRQIAEGK